MIAITGGIVGPVQATIELADRITHTNLIKVATGRPHDEY